MSVISHNLAANFTSRQLNITSNKKAKTAEKLSTGLKINRAADDAAGLQISEKMRWQIRGLNRASDNVQEGISLLQVADGALNEVHSMLQRVNELAVQAANDTNTLQERKAIQAEINEIMAEIDRVGTHTEYNDQKIFAGGIEYMVNPDGDPINPSDIPISGLQLSSMELQNQPFNANSGPEYLGFRVSTIEGYTPATWNLIFGSGSTSHSTLRYHYEAQDANGNPTTITAHVNLENMTVSDYQADTSTNTFERTYSYTGDDGISFKIKQKIQVDKYDENNPTDSLYYNMTYEVENTSGKEVDIDFMFNADTAYNNNDTCEGYFINGQKVNNFCMYTNGANAEYNNQNDAYVYEDLKDANGNTINSFSIVDEDNALSFSEKITWEGGTEPDALSIGAWGSDTGDWNYYDRLDTMLGGNTNNKDIAFSLIWNRDMAADATETFSFKYGIISTNKDPNLANVTLTPDRSGGVRTETLQLWIQSGARENSGMYISIGELSTTGLGLRGINVELHANASQAITLAQNAINKVAKQRSSIGAQQNRLEYSMRIDDNTAENTQAAESVLRDTDMAETMVEFSKHSILEQAGQSMLAQANQSKQGILSLLQ